MYKPINDPELFKQFGRLMTRLMYHTSNLGVFYNGIIKRIDIRIYDEISGGAAAGVTMRGLTPILMLTPKFFLKTDAEKEFTLIHELDHLIYEHPIRLKDLEGPQLGFPKDTPEVEEKIKNGEPLTRKDYDWVTIVNLGADATINQLQDAIVRPKSCILPSTFGLPEGRNTEFYTRSLMEKFKDKESSGGKGGGGGFSAGSSGAPSEPIDPSSLTPEEVEQILEALKEMYGEDEDGKPLNPHEAWSHKPEGESGLDIEVPLEMQSEAIKGLVREAANELTDKQRGSLPGYVKEAVEAAFRERAVPWNVLARRIAATMGRTDLRKSITRKNKTTSMRPGVKVKPGWKFALVIDESGSVADDNWQQMMAEIKHLYDIGAEVWVIKHNSHMTDVYEYKGGPIKYERVSGGTDHTQVIEYLRDNKFDGAFMLTDGYTYVEAGVRPYARCKVVWILTPDGRCPVESGIVDFGYSIMMQMAS